MKDASEKIRILAIDDSVINLKLLELLLGREGFEVSTTNDSLQALPLTLQISPHLILLDVMMPGLSGLEILRQLKLNNLTQSVPVLMVTARTKGEDVKAALEAGAFDYIKKPLDEVEIVARVRSALKYKFHQDRLVEMATHDGLTGLYNHKLLIELLGKELANGRRKAEPVAFCMADIDHFKNLNDQYGHQAGDLVLKEVSQVLSQGVRRTDPVGRYGGEEFGIVLGACGSDRAVALCERLRQSVANHSFVFQGQEIRVTVSLGLAVVQPGEDSVSETELIRKADLALYQAKENGRNRLVS
jgi:diguanylate cyclase (GGDEF)-like protein